MATIPSFEELEEKRKSQNKTTTSKSENDSRSIPSFEEVESLRKERNAPVIQRDLQSKLRSINDLLSTYSRQYSSRYGSGDSYFDSYHDDAGDWLNITNDFMSQWRTQYNEAIQYLVDYADMFNETTTSEVMDYLKNANASATKMKEAVNFENEYFSKFDTAEDYNKDVEKAKIKHFRSSAETREDRQKWYDNSQKRIEELEAERDLIENTTFDWTDHNARQEYNNKIDSIDEEIASIKSDMKQYERGENDYTSKTVDDYYNILLNPDFEQGSANRDFGNAKRSDYDMWYYQTYGGSIIDPATGREIEGSSIMPGTSSIDIYSLAINDPLGFYLDTINGIDQGQYSYTSNGVISREYDKVMADATSGSWDQLEDDEISIYYYLYNTQGYDAAIKYLDDMRVELNRRSTISSNEYTAELYDHAGSLGKIMLNVASVPANVFGNVAGFIEDASATIQGNDINPYSSAHSGMHFGNTVREKTAEDFDKTGFVIPYLDFTLGDIYQVGMSRLDSALATGIGGGLGTVLLGMGAAENEAYRLYERGASPEQVTLGALAAGAAETVFEYASFDKLIKMKDSKTLLQWVKNALIQGGIEASEEGFTEIANIVTNAIIMGSESDWAELVEENGGDKLKALLGMVQQTSQAMFGGFLGGFGAGATQAGKTYINNKINTQANYEQAGKTIMGADGGVDALKALSDEVAGVSSGRIQNDLKKQAGKVSSETATGKGLSKVVAAVKNYSNATKVGRLYYTVQTANNLANTSANQADIAKSLERKGFSYETANDIAEALVASYNGLELTNAQSKLLKSAKNSKVVQDAISNIVTNTKSTMGQRSQNIRSFSNDIALGRLAKAVGVSVDTVKKMADGKPTTVAENASETHYEFSAEGKAIRKDTGDTVNIQKIASIKDGKMTLKLDDGSTLNAKDIAYSSKDEALIYEAVAEMGVNASAANLLVDAFRTSNDVSAPVYVKGIQEAYTYGSYNIPVHEMLEKSSFTSKLTEYQRMTAYKLGELFGGKKTATDQATVSKKKKSEKNQGKVYFDKGAKQISDFRSYVKENGVELSAVQETAIKTMEKLSTALGIDFYVFQSYEKDGKRVYINENGEEVSAPSGKYYRDGRIYIDLNAGNTGKGTMLYTVAHELTHFIRQWSPAKFKVLANFLMKQYGENGKSVRSLVDNQLAKAKRNGRDISFDEAYEEVVADSMETMLNDGNVVQMMAELRMQDKTLWEKICDWFKNLAEDLKAVVDAYKGYNPDSSEGKMVADMQDVILTLESLYSEALMDASENYQTSIPTQERELSDADVQYFTREYDKQVDEVKNNTHDPNNHVYMGTSPFEDSGLPKFADRDPAITEKINESLTMQEAKQMIQRAFVIGNIKEWYDGEYKNGDEWLAGQGAEEVAMYIENEYTLQNAYLDKIQGLLDEEFYLTDVLEAYQEGTLTGKPKKKVDRINIADGVSVADPRFYAPKEIENAKELYDVANQKITNGNRDDVNRARAQILLYAHNKGAAETLGITQSELNKKLRTWGGYSSKARDISQKINAGAHATNRWTGIESLSWLNKATVTDDDVERMVKSVEGNGNRFQNSYIARTMLALDTHIDWSWLTIKFDTVAGVNQSSNYGSRCNGYYRNDSRLIHVKYDAPNTVAHEMGHALDYQWGRDIGYGYTAITEISRNTNRLSGDVLTWFNNFKDFTDSLVASSDLRSEYSMDVKETFARFVAKFVEWTEQLATGRSFGYETSYYNDKFTATQFIQFARLLQEKSAIDANGLTKNSLEKLGNPEPSADYKNTSNDNKEKFSLRDTVEEAKDLVAFHNITESLLTDVLNRNSLLMPSLAVTNKGMTDFGDISLLFDKSTIDPNANKENKLYGADAWTPTQTQLKKNAKFDVDKTIRAVNTMKNRIGMKHVGELLNITPKQFKDAIIKADGSIYDAYAHHIGVQTAYAIEKGIITNIPTTKSDTVDRIALQAQLNPEMDTDNGWRLYKKWLNNISDTIITSYDKASNQDVLNNMKSQPATAKTFKLSENGELVVPAVEYSSIDDMRNNKNRLSDNAAEATKDVANEFLSLANKIDSNTRQVVDAINATFASRYSTADIVKSFRSNGIEITNETAVELQSLYKKAVELPTQYFEAKPHREIALDEIKAAVMPADSSYPEIKQKLEERGIPVVEYKANSKESRIEAINSVDEIKFSDRDYSYNALISKPDMVITDVDGNVPKNRADVVHQAKKNAAKVGKFDPKTGSVTVHVNDVDSDVVLSTGGLRHSLDRRFAVNAPVVLNAGAILQNSIQINELSPEHPDAKGSYVLLGVAKNNIGELYIVRSVVNMFHSDLISMDVLYAINAKTEPQNEQKKNRSGANPQGFADETSDSLSGSKISISALLDYVNKYFPDILPEDVLKHYGYDKRPKGDLGKDALYSDRDPEAIRVNKLLENENAKLKEDVSYLKEMLKLQRQVTGGTKFTKTSVEAAAKQLMKNANAKGNTTELVNLLNGFYEYIAKGEELTWEGVMEQAQPVVEWLQNHYAEKKQISSYAQEILRDLRGSRVYLDEQQKKEAAYAYGSFKAFRNKTMGSLIIANSGSVSLDTKWQELSYSYPNIFDPETSTNDMPAALLDAIDRLRNMTDMDTYGYDEDFVTQDLLHQVYDSYWNVSTLYTVADVKNKEILKLKGEHAKRMADLRSDHREKTEQLKAEHKEALKRVKQEYRDKAEANQQKIIEKYQASKKKAIETRDKREAREKLQKVVLDTVKWITYPSKTDVKCPDILKQPYADFLNGIDLSSQRLANGGDPTQNDLRLANAMSSLATALDRIMASQDPNQDTTAVLDTGYLDLPANFVQKLRDMTEDVKAIMGNSEYVVNRMPAEDVRKLTQMIRTLNHAIKEVSTLYANLRFANVEALGDNTMAFMDALGEIEKTGGVKDFVQWENALPYYAFKRFGEGGESIFEGLMDAQDKLAFLAQDIFNFREKAWTSKEAKAWSEDTHKIDLPNGTSLTLTTADAMSIYCLSRRQQGLQHLLGGGTRVIGIQKGSQKAKDSRSLLTIKDIETIISSLTDRQKQVADAIQEFMSTTCSEWGNEISMKRFLTKEFNEKFYFPIESNDENLATKDPSAQQSDLFRLLNISATKPIDPRANNEVIIRNIFDVFTGHASDMARLNAFGMPLLDYMKWLNYREKTANEEGQINVRGVRKSMERAYGNAAKSYVLNLVKDVNGRASDGGDPTILMKWMRSAKTASVGSSLRVATLQITSYPRASLVLSPKNLALGLSKMPQIGKAKKYCGIALWKSFGFYDTNISRSIEDQIKGVTDVKQKLIELSLKGAEWGDAITWGAFWNACEYEVAATKKYKVGTEEFNQAVAKKLREVVYATQVVDSTLTRSQMMRSKRGLAQEAAAFMSEPTVSANILMDAGFRFNAEKRKTGSVKTAWQKTGKYIGRAVAVYSIGQLAAALLEGFWDAWRDDDDEEFGEKYLNAFVENLALDLIPFNKIPIVSDVFEAGLSMFDVGFYSSDKMSTTWLTQAVSAVDAWKEVLNGGSSMTAYNALYKSLRAVSSFYGVAFSGVMREGVALWNNTAGAYDSTLKIRTWDLSKSDLAGEALDAILEGNDRQASSILAEFSDDDSYQSAMRKAIKDRYTSGEIDYDTAIQYLVEYGGMEEEDAYWKAEEWMYESVTGEDFGKYNEFFTAVQTGKNLKAIIKKYTDNGVEAEKLASEISSHFKPLYKEMSNADRAGIKGYLLNAYELLGYDRSKKSKDIDKWLED